MTTIALSDFANAGSQFRNGARRVDLRIAAICGRDFRAAWIVYTLRLKLGFFRGAPV
jgi:hypothetical protein